MSHSDSSSSASENTGLRSGALGLGGAVIMSAALMGPAVSMYFNPQVAAAHAGFATPFTFVLAALMMAVIANGVMEMSRALPSAGSFYTYVSRGIGPRAGFITGVLMFIAYALLVPAEVALIGTYTHDVLAEYGIHVHWMVVSAVAIVAMTILSLRGITSSIRTALVLFTGEVAVILTLTTIVLFKGGADGLSTGPLNPAGSSHGLSGIALGLVFGLLSFVGFEAATTLGEEVENPHRNVPRGMLLSLVFVGAIYLYCTYAEMIGFGKGGVSALIADQAPFTTLAARYAPWLKLLVGLAGISSIFAVIMNSNNGIVRILYAMGRERMLPQRLATIHPTHGTPSTAIWVQGGVTAVFTFGVGLISGPFNTYVYLGSLLTLAIIPVYALTQVACVWFCRESNDVHRSLVRHVILPVTGLILLIIPVYGQLYPVPDAPLRYFPYLILTAVAVAGVVATVIGRRRPEVLARAGAVLAAGEADAENSAPLDEATR